MTITLATGLVRLFGTTFFGPRENRSKGEVLRVSSCALQEADKNLVGDRSAIRIAAPIWQPNCRSRHKEMTNYRSTFTGIYPGMVAGLTFATELVLPPSRPSPTANAAGDLCV